MVRKIDVPFKNVWGKGNSLILLKLTTKAAQLSGHLGEPASGTTRSTRNGHGPSASPLILTFRMFFFYTRLFPVSKLINYHGSCSGCFVLRQVPPRSRGWPRTHARPPASACPGPGRGRACARRSVEVTRGSRGGARAAAPSPPQAHSPALAALTMAARLAPRPPSATNPLRALRAPTATAMAPGCPARCLTRPKPRRPPEQGGRRARGGWLQPELPPPGEGTLTGAPRGPWATRPCSVALASAATLPHAQVQHPGATRDRGTG